MSNETEGKCPVMHGALTTNSCLLLKRHALLGTYLLFHYSCKKSPKKMCTTTLPIFYVLINIILKNFMFDKNVYKIRL